MRTSTKHTQGEWVIDEDGHVGIEEQAAQLLEDIGTDREWAAIGIKDEDGFAEVVALAHPDNANLITAAPNLLLALQQLVYDYDTRLSKVHPGLKAGGYDGMIELARAAIAKATQSTQ